MPCEALTPQHPSVYYTHTGSTYNFRFEGGGSTVTSFNFQYGPTCDQLSSEVFSVAGTTHTVANFPHAGGSFCLALQAVNDCAVSGWTRIQTGAGTTTVATDTTQTAVASTTTTTDTSTTPTTAAGMPISGSPVITASLLFLGAALIASVMMKWARVQQ